MATIDHPYNNNIMLILQYGTNPILISNAVGIEKELGIPTQFSHWG
jgi:hypothetical protein